MNYDELIKALRMCVIGLCEDCPYDGKNDERLCADGLRMDAANAIKELLKAARAMHTWIFLNTGDEQAAYDECKLSDEMNAMLGYGGQFVAEPPKEGENRDDVPEITTEQAQKEFADFMKTAMKVIIQKAKQEAESEET